MSCLSSRLRVCAALLLIGAALPAQAATVVVTSTDDGVVADGNCTLREAVQATNTNTAVDACAAGDPAGDVIVFMDANTIPQQIVLTGGPIDITDGVTIGEASFSQVTIVASPGSRIFQVSLTSPVEPVAIQGVMLSGGSGATGGTVFVADGQPSAFDSVFFQQSTSAESGGALRVGAGTHTVTNCQFNTNTTTATGVTEGGGALYNDGGALTVTGTSFQNNTAVAGTANGGALLTSAGSTTTLTNSFFVANQAARAGGAVETAGALNVSGGLFEDNTAGVNGGAVHMTGAVTATFTGDTRFEQNSAQMEGGAVWNSSTGTLDMTGSTIVTNTAAGPAADQGGGGVFSDGGITTLTNTTISGNSATGAAGSGGGVQNTAGGRMTITGGQITGNTSVRAGGGVETNQSGTATGNTLSMTDVAVSGNTAGTAPGFGGGVHITGAATVTVTGGLISSNTAVEGGGLWKAGPGTVTVTGTTFGQNTATGALADQGGGAVYNDGAGGTLTLSGVSLEANTATGTAGSGGGLFNNAGATTVLTGGLVVFNTANRAGGGIEDNAGTLLTLTDVSMAFNTAGSAPGNGGALHMSGAGTVVVRGGTIGSNTAVEGGGLWKSGPGTLTVTGTQIGGNTATGAAADQGGGGVYNDGAGGALRLDSLSLSGNRATGAAGSGGGLLNNAGATSRLTDVSVIENTAVRAGGGIEDNAGTLTALMRVTLQGNAAEGGNGGGVHVTGAGTVTVDSSLVQINRSAEGGGLWNSGTGSLTVRTTTFFNNQAGTGGGVYQSAGATGVTRIEQSLLDQNSAATSGGGIAAAGATVILENTTVSRNRAPSGGGLATSGGRFRITNATVIRNEATTAGGGLFRAAAATGDSLLAPSNTLVALNTAPDGANLSGLVLSRGYNLFETTAGATVSAAPGAGPDLTDVNAGLDAVPLADNGGPTQTYAVTESSPARGAGMTPLLVDQRGVSRVAPSTIGAFELSGGPVTGEGTPATTEEAVFGLGAASPNPVRSVATLRVQVAASEPIEVALYDALGRRVQTLYTGTPAAEQSLDVHIDVASLAPGVYVVRAMTASALVTQRITVVR